MSKLTSGPAANPKATTTPSDPDAIERQRDHVLLKSPTSVRDSQAWRETHDPDAGYVPDRPLSGNNSVSTNKLTAIESNLGGSEDKPI